MRIGTLILIAGLLILAVFAAPLAYFLYYVGSHGANTIIVNVSSTPGPPCHDNEYAMRLYYKDPVPITDVTLQVTLYESNGSSYSVSRSASSLSEGHYLLVCLPEGPLTSATSIAVNLTGYIAGLYRLSVALQQGLR